MDAGSAFTGEGRRDEEGGHGERHRREEDRGEDAVGPHDHTEHRQRLVTHVECSYGKERARARGADGDGVVTWSQGLAQAPEREQQARDGEHDR